MKRRQPTRRVRTVILTLGVVSVVLGASACNGDDESPETTPLATSTRVAATARPEASVTAASPGTASQEVVGIVGAVNQGDNRIEINRLSGADVNVVLVSPATRILSGQGRPLTLAELRPSDRIIASGTVDGTEMMAKRVEIQAVLPGASPGG